MTDILETVKALKALKEETADVEANLRELVAAIQGVLSGDRGDAVFEDDGPTETDEESKPPAFADVDYYDLPGKGIPEPLGPAPPPTRTETIRPKDEDDA